MINDRELWALFTLLDDPQPIVYDAVRARLRALGDETIGALRTLSLANHDLHRHEIQEIADVIRFETAVRRIAALDFASRADTALEDGVFLLARYGHPDAVEDGYRRRLDEMARDVRILAGARATSLELTMRLRGYLFADLGFAGNRDDYYNPDNSYMNKVIDFRRGIPITLSALMLLIGKRLHLPLHGIGMPMHFLVRFDDGSRSFFIDTFNGGAVITRDQCRQMLASSGVTLTPAMLEPIGDKAIVERMFRNLLIAYKQTGDELQARRIGELLGELNPDYRVNSVEPEDDGETASDDE
jgi:regulator of sirC expression with transglutaminase-like and TPR domain